MSLSHEKIYCLLKSVMDIKYKCVKECGGRLDYYILSLQLNIDSFFNKSEKRFTQKEINFVKDIVDYYGHAISRYTTIFEDCSDSDAEFIF